MFQTPPRQPFGELLETPTPPSWSGVSAQRPNVLVQRFSLRSRRAQPYPVGTVPIQPGHSCLKPAKGLASQLPSAFVRLCRCSWQAPLQQDRPRLCEHNTDEHDEYFLLVSMCRQFTAERWGGVDVAESVPADACLQQLEVYFIIEQPGETVVGYVAFRLARSTVAVASHADASAEVLADAPSLEHQGSPTALLDGIKTLAQIYVEPEYRRQGLALTALQLLLNQSTAVVLENATPTIEKHLVKLGFTQSARRRRRLSDMEGRQRTLYQRREVSTVDVENMDHVY